MSSDPLFFFIVSVIMAMSIFLFGSSVCNSSFFSAIPLTFHMATFSFPVLCPSVKSHNNNSHAIHTI